MYKKTKTLTASAGASIKFWLEVVKTAQYVVSQISRWLFSVSKKRDIDKIEDQTKIPSDVYKYSFFITI